MIETVAQDPPAAPVVVALTPDQFERWLRGELHDAVTAAGRKVRLPPPWQPGQHWALLAKTREGKTNFAVWVLRVARRFVIALDPKGGDETLTASGWWRITGVPPHKRLPRRAERARVEGKPVRLIVGLPDTRTPEADRANQNLMRQAIEYVRQAGGWALYVDEHQILSDARMFNLGAAIARMAISAARDGVSLVTSIQYLAWVEKAATRQATLIAIWKTKDRDMIQLAARVAGRPWKEIEAAVDLLPKWHVLVIPDELRAPMMIVHPPKVT